MKEPKLNQALKGRNLFRFFTPDLSFRLKEENLKGLAIVFF